MRFHHVFAALLCSTLSLAGCDCEGGNGNPDDVTVTPELIDFGVVIAGSTCTREATVNNGGAERVILNEYKVAEAVFASALARINTAKSDVFASYPMVQVVSAPSIDYAPTSPNIFSNTGTTLVMMTTRITNMMQMMAMG